MSDDEIQQDAAPAQHVTANSEHASIKRRLKRILLRAVEDSKAFENKMRAADLLVQIIVAEDDRKPLPRPRRAKAGETNRKANAMLDVLGRR